MKILLGLCSCGAPFMPESDMCGYYCTGCLASHHLLFEIGSRFSGVRVEPSGSHERFMNPADDPSVSGDTEDLSNDEIWGN